MNEYNVIDSIIYPETPKVTPNEVYYVYVPKAGYDNEGIASFNISDFTIKDGMVCIDPQIIADINYSKDIIGEGKLETKAQTLILAISELFGMVNKNSDTKTHLEGDGGTLDLEVKDGAIYYISGYNLINISAPSGADYTSHLFVSFANNGQAVGFQLPEGMKVYGANPSMVDAGEDWEINIDNIGGALCMKKEVVA